MCQWRVFLHIFLLIQAINSLNQAESQPDSKVFVDPVSALWQYENFYGYFDEFLHHLATIGDVLRKYMLNALES